MVAIRTRALLELLYATGLRVSELVSLPVSVAWRDDPFFMVKGKGAKERMVPVTDTAREGARRTSRRPQYRSARRRLRLAVPGGELCDPHRPAGLSPAT